MTVHHEVANKRIKTKVSQTASYTCFCRACASVERDKRFRGPDDISRSFVPFLPRILFLKCGPLRTLAMKRLGPRGIYEYVSARTKLFDEVYRKSLADSCEQAVILGAGFDTRAVRYHGANCGTRIFEVDTPVTQQMKKLLLERNGIVVPGEVTFVPVDFTGDDLAAALDRAGYRADRKTLFLCEGVTMYLPEAAVRRLLAFIRENAASGNLLIFDYVRSSVLRHENTLYGEKAIHRTVTRANERWVFGIEDGFIDTFLGRHGFTLTDNYSPADLQRRFLTAADGTAFGRINETHCIAIAAPALPGRVIQ